MGLDWNHERTTRQATTVGTDHYCASDRGKKQLKWYIK
jgi:hypothetical protein